MSFPTGTPDRAPASPDLSICPALRDLPVPARQALSERAAAVEFQKGERLESTVEAESLLVLVDGLAKLTGRELNGSPHVMDVYRPGDLIGLRRLFGAADGTWSTIALRKGRALSLSRRDLMRAGRSQPQILLVLAREYSRRMTQTSERLLRTMSEGVAARVGHILLDFTSPAGSRPDGFADLTVPMTHELISQLAGASRPHTTIVLGELESQGALRRLGQRSIAVRPDRLREILERAF